MSRSATTITAAAGASSSRTSPTSTTRSIGTSKDFLFTDVSYATRTAKASLPYVGWGTSFFDYDNDGWLDLMVVNGHVYPQTGQGGGWNRLSRSASCSTTTTAMARSRRSPRQAGRR